MSAEKIKQLFISPFNFGVQPHKFVAKKAKSVRDMSE